MKFFRPAGRMEAEADTLDWTREHGLRQNQPVFLS